MSAPAVEFDYSTPASGDAGDEKPRHLARGTAKRSKHGGRHRPADSGELSLSELLLKAGSRGD